MRQLQEYNIIASMLVSCEKGALTESAINSLKRIDSDYLFYDEHRAIIEAFKILLDLGELIDIASLATTASRACDFTHKDIEARLTVILCDGESNPWFLDTYINRLIYSIKADEVKKLCESMIETCNSGIASNNDISDFNEALKDHIDAVKQF